MSDKVGRIDPNNRAKKPQRTHVRDSAKGSTFPISAWPGQSAKATARNYLTADEVQRMIDSVTPATSRYPARDRAVLLLMFRHGLRVSELCDLQVEDLDLPGGRIYVSRLKRGVAASHPVRPTEVPVLRAWLRERDGWLDRHGRTSPHLFLTERGGPLISRGVYYMIARYGQVAGISVPVHPHMLRHGCGYALAEQVFFNVPLLLTHDAGHSGTESRHRALGRTDGGRLLTIIFTLRGNKTLIRVTSARDMNHKEHLSYEKHSQINPQLQIGGPGARVLGDARHYGLLRRHRHS